MTITIRLRRTTLQVSLAAPKGARSKVAEFVISSSPGSASVSDRLDAVAG